MQREIKLQNRTSTLPLVLTFIIFAILLACSVDQESADNRPGQTNSESFTFFDLGSNTKLTNQVRKGLRKKLGRDAIEHRSIIDLEINYRGFLKRHFSDLDELNRRLNFPPGERVEHDTVKLMYRYAQKMDVPFEYVELVFSGYTDTPILFKIHFRKDESNIVETLKTKYGQPKTIDWKEENGRSMFWKANSDYLVVSMVPDQFGIHEYQIVIFYVENLNQLIDAEQKEKDKKEEQRAKSGKSAF